MSFERRTCRLFTLEDIQKATNRFEWVIGRGGYGNVYLGHIDDEKVAIKTLNSMSKQGKDEFNAELKILSEVQHRNVVSLIGYCDEEEEMILVYEYMPRGSLHDYLYTDGRSPLSWELRLKICIDAAGGLYYLHQGSRSHRRILHGDIKSANILLDENFEAKISDFGLSAIVPTGTGCSWKEQTTLKFSPAYVDPRYSATRKLTKECDVYSFGVVLLEVLCGKKAFDLRAQRDIKEGRLDGNIDPNLVGQVDEEYLLEFARIALKCLKKRPEIIDVLTDLHKLNTRVDPIWQSQDTTVIIEEFKVDNGLGYDITDAEQHFEPSPRSSSSLDQVRSLLGKISSALPWKKTRASKERTANNASPLANLVLEGPSADSLHVTDRTANNTLPLPNIGLEVPFADILFATNDFDSQYLIAESEFWKVYKGTLPSGVKVAMKLHKLQHSQGLPEFQSQITVLSKVCHCHLVSLIGYCDKKSKMILVYEFVEKGTLREHLYNSGKNPNITSSQPELSWTQRLEICIGAARGLHYLHTCSDGGIIHQDVKSTNILIDENYVAKVTDFGLSGLVAPDKIHVTTELDSFGYLDPKYFRTQQLTQKSDVYSFGVVLLEVLCARPAIDLSLPKEEMILAEWGISWQKKGQLIKIIDPLLHEKINPNSLRKFGETVESCLREDGVQRPSMSDVLCNLEYCLLLHQNKVSREPHEDLIIGAASA